MFIINNKYKLLRKLGEGSFGDVYQGVNIETQKYVAIKLESLKCKHPQLEDEYNLYSQFAEEDDSTNIDLNISLIENSALHTSEFVEDSLHQTTEIVTNNNDNLCQKQQCNTTLQKAIMTKRKSQGVPNVYFFGVQDEYRVLVMDYLGPCIEDLFAYCGRRFTLKTVLMLADQMLTRLQYVHSFGQIHRDIKPDNFIMGGLEDGYLCYLIDFGLAQPYLDEFGDHIECSKERSLTGTARYASLTNHLGYEQSRRDDMESLAYSLIYLMRGSLPWQGMKCEKGQDRYHLIFKKKCETQIADLCKDMPNVFGAFLFYCRNLKFDEMPKYDYWRGIFGQCAKENGIVFDWEYDWIVKRKKERKIAV